MIADRPSTPGAVSGAALLVVLLGLAWPDIAEAALSQPRVPGPVATSVLARLPWSAPDRTATDGGDRSGEPALAADRCTETERWIVDTRGRSVFQRVIVCD